MTSKSRAPTSAPRTPKLIAHGNDPRTGEEFDLFECVDRSGKRKEVLIPVDAILKGEQGVLEALHAERVPVPILRVQRAPFVGAMYAPTTTTTIGVASRPGWLGDQFVMAHEVYGDERGRVRRHFPADAPGAGTSPQGTLAGWRSGVAEMARGNHAVTFVLCVAFAAPLLRLLGREGGGFQLVAPSSAAKSTIALAAASVWGMEADGALRTWLGTVNKFDELAERYNDLLLVLDEARLAGRGDGERAEVIGDVAFRAASGRRKGRLGESERGRDWVVLLLSTSERTSGAIAKAAGKEMLEGQLVRLTDVVLPHTPGLGVLQDLHGAESLGDFCARLRRIASENRGAAGDAYLRRLTAEAGRDRAGLVEWLEARTAGYLRQTACSGPVAGRVARRFALVYAAGRLAAKYKLLPHSTAEIRTAVRYCHERACAMDEPSAGRIVAISSPMVDGAGLDDRRLLRRLARHIDRHSRAFLSLDYAGSVEEARAAPGFVRTRADGGREFLFVRAKLLSLFGDRERAVVAALRDHGLIHSHEGGKTSVPMALPSPHGRCRVVCVKEGILRLMGSGRS